MILDAKRFPLLAAVATDLVPAAPTSGLCFHRAAALALDLPAAQLCVGTLRAATAEEIEAEPRASRVPFLHAWVERGAAVYAPTLLEQHGDLRPIPRADYYEANGIRHVHRLNRRDIKRLAARHGWTGRAVFGMRTEGKPSLALVLLQEMGVPFHIVDGVALPADSGSNAGT
jgi:hypothetical protein